jgi:hypothetical protein
MAVKFKFKITHTADSSMFLQPYKMMLEVESLEETLTEYEIEHAFPATESARPMVPSLLKSQIRYETGIDNFDLKKYFFESDGYIIRLPDAESYLLFKLHYYGSGI